MWNFWQGGIGDVLLHLTSSPLQTLKVAVLAPASPSLERVPRACGDDSRTGQRGEGQRTERLGEAFFSALVCSHTAITLNKLVDFLMLFIIIIYLKDNLV